MSKNYQRHGDCRYYINDDDVVTCPNKACKHTGTVMVSHSHTNPDRPFFSCIDGCGLFWWLDQRPSSQGKPNYNPVAAREKYEAKKREREDGREEKHEKHEKREETQGAGEPIQMTPNQKAEGGNDQPLVRSNAPTIQIQMLQFLGDLRKSANDPITTIAKIDEMQQKLINTL